MPSSNFQKIPKTTFYHLSFLNFLTGTDFKIFPPSHLKNLELQVGENFRKIENNDPLEYLLAVSRISELYFFTYDGAYFFQIN